ncbi:MAG TPA: YkvA family protein [Longimicrobiales bacterium]
MARIRIGRSKRRRNTAVKLLRELPNLVKLLVRLLRDARVSKLDRMLFGGVLAYVLLPADLLPDFLGVFGLTDDLFLIGLALNRLFARAGADVLLQHWDGNPRALGYLVEGVEEIGGLLPARIRNALRGFV